MNIRENSDNLNKEMIVDLKEEQRGDVLILRIRGRLDAISAPAAEKKIFESIDKSEYKILIDMSGVNYLSSAGMRMLLSTSKRLRALSGKLYLSGLTVSVLDVLRMSGFDHVLDLFESEEEAFRQF